MAARLLRQETLHAVNENVVQAARQQLPNLRYHHDDLNGTLRLPTWWEALFVPLHAAQIQLDNADLQQLQNISIGSFRHRHAHRCTDNEQGAQVEGHDDSHYGRQRAFPWSRFLRTRHRFLDDVFRCDCRRSRANSRSGATFNHIQTCANWRTRNNLCFVVRVWQCGAIVERRHVHASLQVDHRHSPRWNLLAHTRHADDCPVPCSVSFNSDHLKSLLKFLFQSHSLAEAFRRHKQTQRDAHRRSHWK